MNLPIVRNAKAIDADAHVALLSTVARLRDLGELTKPGILLFCVLMTAVGAWLTHQPFALTTIFLVLVGTGLAVGGANALNMVIERDTDKLMQRTKNRPLPAGRMTTEVALTFGVLLIVAGCLILYWVANATSALLTAFAAASYVLLYTPLKARTPLALFAGTIPGALPPLIGWTSITGSIGIPGLALFGVLMLWQIPHFLAIALFAKQDYARAGIRIFPLTHGDFCSRVIALVTSAILIPTSIVLGLVSFSQSFFAWFAGILSLSFFLYGLATMRDRAGNTGARRFFLASLAYLPLLSAGLILSLAWA